MASETSPPDSLGGRSSTRASSGGTAAADRGEGGENLRAVSFDSNNRRINYYAAADAASPAASLHAPLSPIRTPIIPNQYFLNEEEFNGLAPFVDFNNKPGHMQVILPLVKPEYNKWIHKSCPPHWFAPVGADLRTAIASLHYWYCGLSIEEQKKEVQKWKALKQREKTLYQRRKSELMMCRPRCRPTPGPLQIPPAPIRKQLAGYVPPQHSNLEMVQMASRYRMDKATSQRRARQSVQSTAPPGRSLSEGERLVVCDIVREKIVGDIILREGERIKAAIHGIVRGGMEGDLISILVEANRNLGYEWMCKNLYKDVIGSEFTEYLRNQDDDWYSSYILALCRKRGFSAISEYHEWRKKEGVAHYKLLGFARGVIGSRLADMFRRKGFDPFNHSEGERIKAAIHPIRDIIMERIVGEIILREGERIKAAIRGIVRGGMEGDLISILVEANHNLGYEWMRKNLYNDDSPEFTEYLRKQDDDWYSSYILALCRKRGFSAISEYHEWKKKENVTHYKLLGIASGVIGSRLRDMFKVKGFDPFYHLTLNQDPEHPLNMLLKVMRQVIMEGQGPAVSDDNFEVIKFLHKMREGLVNGSLTATQVDQQISSLARRKVNAYFVDESKNTWIVREDDESWMPLKDRCYDVTVASLRAATRDFCRNEFDYKEKLPTGLAKEIIIKVISVVKKEFRVLKIGSSRDPSKLRRRDNKMYPAKNFIRESMEIFGLSLSIEQRYACERFAVVVAASFGVVANKGLPRSTIPYTDEGAGADLYVMPARELSIEDHFAIYEEHRHGPRAGPGHGIVPDPDSESPSTSEEAVGVDASSEDAMAPESPSSHLASGQANRDIEEDDMAILDFNIGNDDESITSESQTFRTVGRDASTNTESPFDEIDRDPSPVNVMDVPNASHRQLFEEERLGLLREQRELAREQRELTREQRELTIEQRRVTQLQGNVLERQSNQEDLTRRVNVRARERYKNNRSLKRKFMNNPDTVQRVVRTMVDDSKAPKGMSQEALDDWEDCFHDDDD